MANLIQWGNGGIVHQYKDIDLYVVTQALGLPTHGMTVGGGIQLIDYDVVDLCRHSAINMWSLNKPVEYDKYAVLLDSERRSVNYGLTASGMAFSAIPAAITAGTYGWSYIRPSGWMRLTDFAGYNHAAKPPVVLEAQTATPCIGETCRFFIDDKGIRQWPLLASKTLHLGLYVVGVGMYPLTTPITGMTAQDYLNDGKMPIPITAGRFANGTTYTAYAVLFNAGITTQQWVTSVTSGTFYILPSAPATFTPRTRVTVPMRTTIQVTSGTFTFTPQSGQTGVTISNISCSMRVLLRHHSDIAKTLYTYVVRVAMRCVIGNSSVEQDIGSFTTTVNLTNVANGGEVPSVETTLTSSNSYELGADPKEEDTIPLVIYYEAFQGASTVASSSVGTGVAYSHLSRNN